MAMGGGREFQMHGGVSHMESATFTPFTHNVARDCKNRPQSQHCERGRMRRAVARFWAWVCTCLRRLLSLLLLVGPTPRHVAFIMDGNRRFASSKHMDKIGGHKQGYSKMVDVIHWCLEAGVQCMSVYAFSIDNFKRSPEEVASLMQLAEEKYKELAQVGGVSFPALAENTSKDAMHEQVLL